MKLSDIITLVENEEVKKVKEIKDDSELQSQYLVFDKYGEQYVRMVTDDCVCSDTLVYKVSNPELINLEYLYYYLVLNTKLFKNEISDANFINNVELPDSLLQYDMKLLENIRKLYEEGIDSCDIEIDQHSCAVVNNIDLSAICSKSYVRTTASELFKITNKELFSKNVKKGNFKDPIEDYIEILKADLVDKEFLLYFLYYTCSVSAPSGHSRYQCYIDDIELDKLNLLLPGILDQKDMIPSIKEIHNKISKLLTKRKEAKLALRQLINGM